ncbi:MAG TPA: ATP-binding protein, partial [Nitrolancea sp.]|nr:ATP-binding protein [Nitrolancea sp.]
LELANRLEVVSHSVLAVTSALELDTVLRRIVDLARELAGARYAALGVPGHDGRLQAFVTSGIDEAEAAAIGPPPRGLGILGLLLAEPKTIRLSDLTRHPASVGFPKGHPAMHSFLGVPIVARGRVVGNLYLTEKLRGQDFSEEDAQLVEMLARHAAVAIENARLYQAVEEQERRLGLLIDQLPEAVLVLATEPERVSLANREASRLLGWQIEPPVPLADFLSRNPRLHTDGSSLPLEDVHIVRSLREGALVERDEIRLRRTDGAILTLLVNSVPLAAPDRGGTIHGAIAVFQDITQIKDAEQLKDDFLSLVSHELRTPLTTIRGDATLLQRDWARLPAGAREDLLNDLSAESQRLAILIQNMVQLASIRAGRLALEGEPVLVGALIERAAAAIAELAPGQPLTVAVEPGLVAEADPSLVEQTLHILLNNAVKYAPGAPIEVSGRRVEGQIVVAVRDHGPGIEVEELPHMFERFHRARRSRESQTPGLGLGLYLARHLVEANGGRIWIESPPDGGARIAFSLPAASPDEE